MAFTDPVFQWLAYELAAIFAIIAIWLIYRMSRKSRKIAVETRSAVNSIKQSREDRRHQLSETLHANYGFDGDTLAAELDALMARERELHKYAMGVFVGQDAQALANLNTAIQQHLDAGLAITPISLSVPSESTQQVQQLAAENAELTATISRLTKQLEQAEAAQAAEQIVVEFAEAEVEDDAPDEIDPETTVFSDDVALFEDDVESLLAGQDIELSDESVTESAEADVVEDDVPVVPEIFSDETEAQLLEEALFGEDIAESEADQTPEQTEVAADEEPEPVTSKSRMAEFANADWNAAIPDIYGKSTFVSTEPVEAAEEKEEKIVAVKSPNRLNDFLKQDWQPNTPDIYGKQPPMQELDKDAEPESAALDSVAEQSDNTMSAHDEAEDDLLLSPDEEERVTDASIAPVSDAEDLSQSISSLAENHEETQRIEDDEAEWMGDQQISDETTIDDIINDSAPAQETVPPQDNAEAALVDEQDGAAEIKVEADDVIDTIETLDATEQVSQQNTAEALIDEQDVAADVEIEVDDVINTTEASKETDHVALQSNAEILVDEQDGATEIEVEAEDVVDTTETVEETATDTEIIPPPDFAEALVDDDDTTDFETEADRIAALMAAPEPTVQETDDTQQPADQTLQVEDQVEPEPQTVPAAPSFQEKAKTDIDSPPDALEKLRARLRQKTAALAATRTSAIESPEAVNTVQVEQKNNSDEQTVLSDKTDPVETPVLADTVNLSDEADNAHADDASLSVDNLIETTPAIENHLLDPEQETVPAIPSGTDMVQPDFPLAESDDELTVLNAADAIKGIEEDIESLLEDTSAPEPKEETKTAEALDGVEIPAAETNTPEADITPEPAELSVAPTLDETVAAASPDNTDAMDEQIDPEKLSASNSNELTDEPAVDEINQIEDEVDSLLDEASSPSAPEPKEEIKATEVLDEVESPVAETNTPEVDVIPEPAELSAAPTIDETVAAASSDNTDVMDEQIDPEKLSSSDSNELTVEPAVDETDELENAVDSLLDEASRPSTPEPEPKEENKTAEVLDEAEIAAAEANTTEADITPETAERLAVPAIDEIVDAATPDNVDVMDEQTESEKLSESQDVSEEVSKKAADEIEDFAAALAREEALAAEEKARTEAEIAGFEKQATQPALPEEKDISVFLNELDQLRDSQKAANQLENQAHLNAAADTPLPEQTELDKLMDEVRTLQTHSKLKPVSDKDQQTALRSILSSIPSFADTKSRQS